MTLSFAPDSIKDTFETVVETKDGYEVMLEAGSVAVCEIRQGNELAFRLVWEFMNRWCHN